MRVPPPAFSVRLYGLLLRLYPKPFREEYGEEMVHLFEDQWRDAAGRSNPGWGKSKLWLQTVADVAASVIAQHIDNLGGKMNSTPVDGSLHELSFGRLVAAIATTLALVCIVATVFWVPRTYQSTVRIEVTQGMAYGYGRQADAVGTRSPAVYDPYFIQTAFEKIKSREVLEPVFDELRLGEWLGLEQELNRPLTFPEAYPVLTSMIDLRQMRNTSLVEIRVYSASDKVSARVANKISEVFARTGSPKFNTVLVDAAMPNERPIRPNVPLNITAGTILSILAALLIAGFLKLVAKIQRRARLA